MRNIGVWRALAAISLVATISLFALGQIEGAVLAALTVGTIAMIVLAERIGQLERQTFGEVAGERVRTCTNWAYWRQPEIVVALVTTALGSVRLATGPDLGETLVLIAIAGAGAAVMRRAHARAWRRSGSQWTEERWRDCHGDEVRQLFCEGKRPAQAVTPGHPLHGKRVYLVLRSTSRRTETLIALSAPGEWARQRLSHRQGPGTHEVEVVTGDGPSITERWLAGSVDGVIHAPGAHRIDRTLDCSRGLGIWMHREGGESTHVEFGGEGEGWRRRVRAFMSVAQTRAAALRGSEDNAK